MPCQRTQRRSPPRRRSKSAIRSGGSRFAALGRSREGAAFFSGKSGSLFRSLMSRWFCINFQTALGFGLRGGFMTTFGQYLFLALGIALGAVARAHPLPNLG